MQDINTLLYASVLIAIPIIFMLAVASWLNRKVPGASVLALGMMGFIGSFILQGLAQGPILTIIANSLTALGLYLIWLAYKRFNERKCPGPRWILVFPVLLVVLQLILIYSTQWQALYQWLMLIYALLAVLIIIELLHSEKRIHAADWIVASVYLCLALVYLYAIAIMPQAGSAALFSLYTQYVDILALLLLPLLGFSYFISLTDHLGKHLARLADTDYLTGLPGRRAFNEQAERILQRAALNQIPVSLLVVNIDDFKKLNSAYGHSAGDKVLMHYTRNMLEFFRIGDVISRMGWDEFMVLLPGSDEQQAIIIGERLRDLFDATLIDIGGRQVSATVSIGGSSALGQQMILEDLCRQAYIALHKAKQQGKHCVVIEAYSNEDQHSNESSIDSSSAT